jgi:hypothetical protein
VTVILMLGNSILGCGGTEEDKMKRGLVVDAEEAAPGSASEFDMTEAERQAQIEREDEAKEDARFDAAQE